MTERKLIPLTEAAQRLGISRMTMSRLVKRGRFTIYDNPLDQRHKLVDEGEIMEGVQPRPRQPEPEGKAAA